MDRRRGTHAARNRIPVLLIEPDRALGPTLVEVLRRNGFLPEWKETYGDGLKTLESPRYSLVYLGIHGPSREGLRVLQSLRSPSREGP